jgi:chemotaxis protein CheX
MTTISKRSWLPFSDQRECAIRYDVDFINPFLEAVVDVLQTMAQIQVTPGKPYVNKKRKSAGDITGLVRISGFAEGTIALSLSKGAILAIVNAMLSESYTEIDKDIADAVGELTNMVSGQARMHLSEQGMSFSASTPTVAQGKGVPVDHVKAPILAIPFTTESGDLVVEAAFMEVSESEIRNSRTER